MTPLRRFAVIAQRRQFPGPFGSAVSDSQPGITTPRTIALRASPSEKFLSFSLVSGLLEGGAKSDATAALFLALYKAFDERKASFAQGTLQIVLDSETADRIVEKARSLGLNVTIRDQ